MAVRTRRRELSALEAAGRFQSQPETDDDRVLLEQVPRPG